MNLRTKHGNMAGVTQLPILIAGGGIAGIAAALAAAKAGRDARVFERASAFEEVGAGLQLGPNAVKALQRIGAWEHVSAIASAPPAIIMRDAMSGKLLRRIQLTGVFDEMYGAPYRVAHRADLHSALLAAAADCPSVQVMGGAAVASVQDMGSNVQITLQDGRSAEGDFLVAADGMRSGLRQKLWPGSQSVFAGQIIHRALAETVPDAPDRDCVNLWMGPGFHAVHYPVGKQQRLNIVLVAHRDQAVDDIASVCASGLSDILSSVPSWLPWEARHVPPLSSWVKGRVMLLGDAAHGTVPYFAQGSAMALEDAALLADILEEAGTLPANFARINERMPRVSAVHQASMRQGHIYSAGGLTALGRNMTIKFMSEERFLSRLAWLYTHG
jgi:2-polyprenyl-6-methoxyphenol hydroxylase-like FAD-dependent oxidoreductase